jgi:hypothetical protein
VDVLRLTGYTLQFERSVADARAALSSTIPQLALICPRLDPRASKLGNAGVEAELQAFFEELKDVCPQIVVSSTDDATLLLAERLGLFVQRSPAHRES